MAWSWSHSVEAYADARANLDELPHATLVTIWAEWRCWDGEYVMPQLRDDLDYDAQERVADELPDDVLADAIWDKSEEYARCDNGGFNAHVCPFGCHTVPFSRD